MPNGRERVEELMFLAQECWVQTTPARSSVVAAQDRADAIAADLDELERLRAERARPRITQCASRHWRAFFSKVNDVVIGTPRANGFDVEGE